MEKFAVILAGGTGTRFWPLSRINTPKQLLNLSGNDAMINETIKRYSGIISNENTIIVTNKIQSELMDKILHLEISRSNIILEPFGRNTAPCLALAALFIHQRIEDSQIDKDAVIIVLPADHYISEIPTFREVLNRIIAAAIDNNKIITIGIKPTFPAIGYGYLKFDKNERIYSDDFYNVDEFVEKPNISNATKYFNDGTYFWNSGILAGKVSVILDNLKRYLPKIFKLLHNTFKYDNYTELLEETYKNISPISIDYGILERSDDIIAIEGQFGWSDIGSWDVVGTIFPSDDNGNIIQTKHISINTSNSIIYSQNKLIATIGIDKMIIVDTDDALLVCSKDNAQKVKELVDILRKENMVSYL